MGLHSYLKNTLYIISVLCPYRQMLPKFFLGSRGVVNYGVLPSSLAWRVPAPESAGNTSPMLLLLMGVSALQASLRGLRGFSQRERYIYWGSPLPWGLPWLSHQSVSYDPLCMPPRGSFTLSEGALLSAGLAASLLSQGRLGNPC